MALESFFTMVATHHSCAVKYMMVTSSSPIAWQLRESITQSGFTEHRLWGNSFHCIGSSGSLLMITSLSPPPCPPLPELAKACISTPAISDKAPIKGPHAKVSSAFVSDAAFYSESTLLTFCSWCPGHELCPEVS